MQLCNSLLKLAPLLSIASAFSPLQDSEDLFGLASRDLDALISIRDALDIYAEVLAPRAPPKKNAQGQPIVNYDSKTQPKTVENKLKPVSQGGATDTYKPLRQGESQYRKDADAEKRKKPAPKDKDGKTQFLDHARVSSSKEGKDASKKGQNALGYAPGKEQRSKSFFHQKFGRQTATNYNIEEAKDVNAANKEARKTGTKVANQVDGKPLSEVRGSKRKAESPDPAGAAKKRTRKTRRALEPLLTRQLLARDALAEALESLILKESVTDLYARGLEFDDEMHRV